MREIFLGMLGLCMGTTIASGVVAFIISVLSALHLYEPLVDYAGAGASVPLIGFGHLLFQGVKEEMEQVGVLGVFTGGLKASAGGISAALIFGYLASLFFHPQMKN